MSGVSDDEQVDVGLEELVVALAVAVVLSLNLFVPEKEFG